MRVLGLEPAAAPGAWSLPDAPADEMQAEQERLGLIANGRASEAEQRRWFIFPRAYERLAATRRARGIAKT
jgi:hypothetical protein